MTAQTSEITEIRPQPRQEQFLASPADIVIYGGAAGGGKTWSLLVEPLRYLTNPEFGAVVFRRTIPEITHEGGMWDEARKLYPLFGGQSNVNEHQYRFPAGMVVTFSHLQRVEDVYNWRSAQIPLIEFDQLETFTAYQFFYMLSRNRSMCGVKPYVRATCNPEPGWLADFLAWWIGVDGYAIPERSGNTRYFVRVNDVIYWAGTPEELTAQYPDSKPLSVTFILSTIFDNPILLETDPGYLANLEALPQVDRERLLGDRQKGGNWKIRSTTGKVFDNIVIRKISDEEIYGKADRHGIKVGGFDRILQGLDWGYFPDPFHWGRLHYDAARRTLYIFDEYRCRKSDASNQETARYLIDHKGVQPRDLIIADSAEPKSVADYREFGLNCRGAEKGPGSLKTAMKWLQSLTAIVIDPDRAPEAATEFLNYELEKDRSGEYISEYPDRDDHAIAMARYATNLIWRRRGQ